MDQIKGTYTSRSVTYPWEGRLGKGPGVTQVSGIDGLWLISAGSKSGKLEFYQSGNRRDGRIWFDLYQRWENLSDIIFTPGTGRLEFTRPHINKEERAFYARVAGVANTFFTGEAFAWAGTLGVILSPLIIMAHLLFFIYLFGKIRKTWFSVYVFSFFLYKILIGIFGGISYFVFSSIHIILVGFLLFWFGWHYLKRKNIPLFNEVANKLCIF
jgi:hypothetical protein